MDLGMGGGGTGGCGGSAAFVSLTVSLSLEIVDRLLLGSGTGTDA